MKKALFIPVGLIVLIALASLLETVKGDVIPNSVFTPEPTTPTPDMSTMEVSRDVWTSPDGQWVVENITTYPAKESDSTYYIGLIARSADGQKEWKLVDEWIERANDKPSYTAALLWSQDGRSLYYVLYRYRTLNARCKLDPLKYDLEYMDYGQELRKVDLDSGKVTELASCALSRPEYSPDGKIVAYIGDEEIALIEVDSGEKYTIPFDIGQRKVQFMGYVVWSPDSKAFAFDIRFSVEGESTVWVVDVDSLSARQIVLEGEDRLEIGRWEGPSRLAIEVIENGPIKRWVWDRESDTITCQVIPTKTPTSVAMSTPDLATMEVDRRISTSPDGQWFAETIIALPHEDSGIDRMYTGLTIRNKDGNIEWQVVDEWEPLGLGWSFPQPIRWSRDGLGLYYTTRIVSDGSVIFPPEVGLYRVNLISGKVTELFSSGQYLSWFALSPNEETVAYIKDRNEAGNLLPVILLVLRDLGNGEERVVPISQLSRSSDYGYGLKILWSPDGKILAITEADGMADSGGLTSILLVDAQSLEVKPLILEDKEYRVAEEWLDPGKLGLKGPGGRRWVWNMQTEVLTMLEGESIPTTGTCPTATVTP